MGPILVLALACLVLAFFGRYYKYFKDKKVIANDDIFQQRGVTIDYKAGTIKIKKHVYPVSAVTGISRTVNLNSSKDFFIKIEVDDMAKPVHNIPVIGNVTMADEFIQRICIALRKAGGPSFR